MTYEVLLMKMKKKKNTKNPTMQQFSYENEEKKYQKSNSQLLMFSQDSWTAEVYTPNIN